MPPREPVGKRGASAQHRGRRFPMANGRQRSPHPIQWAEKWGGRQMLAAASCNSPGAYQPGGGGPCCCQSQAHPRTKLFADKVSATVQFMCRHRLSGHKIKVNQAAKRAAGCNPSLRLLLIVTRLPPLCLLVQ